MRTLGLIGLVGFTACLVEPADATTSSYQALRGGDADAGLAFTQVFLVRMRFDNGQQYGCTATHITPRSLMLAAHCFDAAAANATELTGLWATNVSPAPPSNDPRWVPLVAHRAHPEWSRAKPAINDIALALFDDAGVEAPFSAYLNRALTAHDIGAPLEVVGYGITAKGQSDQGTRRAARLPLAALTASNLEVGNHTDIGLCSGDSGGPSFLRGPDGVLRVAGLHSYDSSLECTYGQDSRVDLFGPFIRQWLADTEGASCIEDGLCADTDCSTPDPDCAPLFASCTIANQCRSHLCAPDPVRATQYCSQACSSEHPCPPSAACASNGVCLLEAPQLSPLGTPCSTGSTCVAGSSCLPTADGTTRCVTACSSDANCPGSRCSDSHVCLVTANLGEACVPLVSQCASGSTCTSQGGLARCEEERVGCATIPTTGGLWLWALRWRRRSRKTLK